MGHVRLGVLPASRKWRQVVEQLRLGADADLIAAAVAIAAEASFKRASYDPAFLHSFWLLTQIPLAARSSRFAEDLRRLGVPVPDRPGVMDLGAAISEAVDQHAREHGGRTDLGEMAQMAAVESFTAVLGANLPSLFAPTPEEVQRAVGRLASGTAFSILATSSD
jgi:predicted alternative tryptophan synthase beta-subunit